MLWNINEIGPRIKSFFIDLHGKLLIEVTGMIEARLEEEVSQWLYRERYARRKQVSRRSRATCQKCGSQRASDFRRNGSRQRQLVTQFGVIAYRLPRVRCVCGGSVRIPFSILKPYQRIWDDVMAQIQRWANLGLSLRQMQTEIGEVFNTQVGLRTLNQVVHDVRPPLEMTLSSVPPIVMLDAIWVTMLRPTGETRTDTLTRQRTVKTKHKVCVLVALGIYPQNGRWGVLGWQIADAESRDAWEALLVPLEARGLYRERGLKLLIHDGGAGLRAALDYLYPHIPHQRCRFHKFRNLWHSIRVPDGLSSSATRHFKQQYLVQLYPIFDAADANEATRLRDAVTAKWADQQPQLVATLQRDWHETTAFWRVLERFPTWPRTALQTTSLLERINQMLRRLFRPKAAFHSLAGLKATVARVLNPIRLT